MSNRGQTKPSAASREYRIYGATNVIGDNGEVLNDPTRKRTSSQREARRALIGMQIEASVRAKCPMHPVREADVLASMEAELGMEEE